MLGQKIWCVVVRRGVCSGEIKPGEKRVFRKHTEVPIKDPKLFWIEPSDCAKQLKTWRELEEEYSCAMMVRYSAKVAPERRFFNIESGDLYICRRGCMQPCIPPPCYDPEYNSIWQNALYRLSRLCALAVFIGLVYGSHALHIWGPSGPTLDALLADSDGAIDQLGQVGSVAAKWWNTVVSVMFDVIRYVFPTIPKDDEFDQNDFVLTVQEELKDRKEREAAALVKEDEDVFEEWELVYNYVPEAPKLSVEVVDDADWLWMEHDDETFIKSSKANMPYEKSALNLKTQRGDKDGITLASIYTDPCSTWSVTKGADEEEVIECFEDTPIGRICKSKRDRRKKARINPDNCATCPLGGSEKPE